MLPTRKFPSAWTDRRVTTSRTPEVPLHWPAEPVTLTSAPVTVAFGRPEIASWRAAGSSGGRAPEADADAGEVRPVRARAAPMAARCLLIRLIVETRRRHRIAE